MKTTYSPAGVIFNYSPVQIFKTLLLIVIMLCLLSLISTEVYSTTSSGGVKHIMLKFNVGQENNVPTWFSSTLYIFVSMIAFWIAFTVQSMKTSRFLIHWYGIATLGLLLSIDESSSFHELLTPATKHFINTAGFFDNAWMIPIAGLVIAFTILYIPWLISLPRRIAVIFITAGLLLVTGAMGFEGIGSLVLERYGADLFYHFIVAVEEGLEMVGISTAIYGLLLHSQTLSNAALNVKKTVTP